MSETNTLVRGPSLDHPDCQAVSEVLARVGDKWTVLVVTTLAQGPLRYNQISRLIDGISQRMLTLTLKSLERDGLVQRTVYPTVPPRVDYELTELGSTLIVPLRGLFDWAVSNRATMLDSRNQFAARVAEAGADEPGVRRHSVR